MRTPIAIGLLSLAACSIEERAPVEPLAKLDLRAALGAPDVTPVGFAVQDGVRYVFDELYGLYRVEGDQLVEVVRMDQMPNPGPTAPIKPPFTDLVAYAPNVFAVTAIGDGYLLDTQAMTLTQHFCYLPGDDGTGVPLAIVQRTDAIAYDWQTNSIYAQPVTRDVAGTFVRSELAMYDSRTGDDTAWFSVDEDVAATAMITRDGGLVLGQGSRLTHAAINGTQRHELDDLARFGVRSIDGMTIDADANTLIVVDKETDAMFDIDLATITLD